MTMADIKIALRYFSLMVCGALAGCDSPPPETGEIVMVAQASEDVWVVLDKRTGCEYFWTTGGGLELRADPKGVVTPKCRS